jgi:hypothetical protein
LSSAFNRGMIPSLASMSSIFIQAPSTIKSPSLSR